MIEILAKYFSGNATDKEILQVKEWRNESEENSAEFLEYSESWNGAINNIDNKAAFSKVLSEINNDNQVFIEQKSSFSRYLKYAAVLVLGIGLAYFAFNYSTSDSVDNKIAVQTIQKQTQDIVLPDGSKVYLSENSSVSYVNDFSGATREVVLKGKAFFDITRDENKPFIVRTGDSEIKVLGTSFLVDTHSGRNTEVVVKTGKVSVAKKSVLSTQPTIELNPGEMGIVKNRVEKSTNINKNYLSWQTKIIDFNRSQMSEVVKTLEEVYFVDIKVSDTKINNCTLSAKFDHREIDVVMEIIGQTFGLELEQKGKDRFILSGAGCSAN